MWEGAVGSMHHPTFTLHGGDLHACARLSQAENMLAGSSTCCTTNGYSWDICFGRLAACNTRKTQLVSGICLRVFVIIKGAQVACKKAIEELLEEVHGWH